MKFLDKVVDHGHRRIDGPAPGHDVDLVVHLEGADDPDDVDEQKRRPQRRQRDGAKRSPRPRTVDRSRLVSLTRNSL